MHDAAIVTDEVGTIAHLPGHLLDGATSHVLGSFDVFFRRAEGRHAKTQSLQARGKLGVVGPALACPESRLGTTMQADQLAGRPPIRHLAEVILPRVTFVVVDAQKVLCRLEVEYRFV